MWKELTFIDKCLIIFVCIVVVTISFTSGFLMGISSGTQKKVQTNVQYQKIIEYVQKLKEVSD